MRERAVTNFKLSAIKNKVLSSHSSVYEYSSLLGGNITYLVKFINTSQECIVSVFMAATLNTAVSNLYYIYTHTHTDSGVARFLTPRASTHSGCPDRNHEL